VGDVPGRGRLAGASPAPGSTVIPVTEDLGFVGRAYTYRGDPFWQLTYGTRGSGETAWHLARLEEGQPAVGWRNTGGRSRTRQRSGQL
jgi:hypothetical protein